MRIETVKERKIDVKKINSTMIGLTPMTLEEFYDRNQKSQKEISTGKIITQSDVKKHFERKSK